MLRRLQQTHAAHAAVRHLLPPVAGADDVLTTYELTHQAVQQLIVTTHTGAHPVLVGAFAAEARSLQWLAHTGPIRR